jgi:hypothetical protein
MSHESQSQVTVTVMSHGHKLQSQVIVINTNIVRSPQK